MTIGPGDVTAAGRGNVLRRFSKEWGKPEVKRTTSRDCEVVDVYGCPPRGGTKVFRAATVGASQVQPDDGQPRNGAWPIHTVGPLRNDRAHRVIAPLSRPGWRSQGVKTVLPSIERVHAN